MEGREVFLPSCVYSTTSVTGAIHAYRELCAIRILQASPSGTLVQVENLAGLAPDGGRDLLGEFLNHALALAALESRTEAPS